MKEKGYWTNRDDDGLSFSSEPIVQVDPNYFRPTVVETLLGDATKAKEKLGWSFKTSFQELVS